ncbi:MAG: riboflavin synthase [Actinomycetota bacterium]|nr:riboflavin synthase [Actinomycetota bacterium]
MFTGIVEECGRFLGRDGGRFRFEASTVLEDAQIGGSIAVNGACLTVVAFGAGWWEADVVDETLSRTTLGLLTPGDPVNLERPVRLSDRLAGHLVQGHVDGVGEVVAPPPELVIRPPVALARYLAEKGSVAVQGVSLTVARAGDDSFTVAVIPHTAAVTNLGRLQTGDRVNLEVDLVARYVARLLGTPGKMS